MGTSLTWEKQFKLTYTYDYILSLIKRRKKNIINFIIIYCFFHLKKLEFPSPKDALCQDWLKLTQWLWRRKFFNFVDIFSLFHNYLPFERGGALYLNKMESHSHKKLSAQFGWNWPSSSRTNLNPLHQSMLCVKFGWNWPSSSGQEDF